MTPILIAVCAWCRKHGRPHGAARAVEDSVWVEVPHEFVDQFTRDGCATHGMCPPCKQQVVADYIAKRGSPNASAAAA